VGVDMYMSLRVPMGTSDALTTSNLPLGQADCFGAVDGDGEYTAIATALRHDIFSEELPTTQRLEGQGFHFAG
jgi:hypothetical protein